MKITIEAVSTDAGVKVNLDAQSMTKGQATKNYLCIIQTCFEELAEITDEEDYKLLLTALRKAVDGI